MTRQRTKNRVGLYGPKTREFQKNLTYEAFKMTFKTGNVYKYLGDASNENPNINDIGKNTFFEIQKRAYDKTAVGVYLGIESPSESKMDLSQYGIIDPSAEELRVKIHTNDFYCLGREIIVGDAIEIPFYERDCKPAFFEVSDVDRDQSYEKFYFNLTLKPMNDSIKTQELDIERSNENLFDEVKEEKDQQNEERVPYEGIDDSPVYASDPAQEEESTDYRNKKQSGFMDNPLYNFPDNDNEDSN